MPVKPKHSVAGRPSAQRQFTDREDFIAAFRQALAGHKPDAHQVLVYYGVGGIGKTSLRKELQHMLEDKEKTISAVLDFDVHNYRDLETALFALRRFLQDKYKVHFPTFDVAYAAYWQKTRPQTPFNKENLPLLEDSVNLGDIIHLAGDLPLIGIISRLGVFAIKGSILLRDWWERRGHAELKGLAEMEPPDIAERLPMFWASDLRDWIVQKAARAVIFLDTYEALTQGERAEGQLRRRDAWVQELVAQLPEVLWVICGRERLRWAEVDPEWAASLEQHLVGGLADSDARHFLAACGIANPEIQQAIIASSENVPYYLDLAVDTWQEIRDRAGREPTAGDFARTPLEILDRFLRHLNQPEVETLKVLSAARAWDYPRFELLVTKFQTGYPATAFAELCRFSFINEDKTAGFWHMHQLMRQSLQEHQDPELNQRVHWFLLEYYERQLAGLQLSAITPRHRAAFTEVFYHGTIVLGLHELLDLMQRLGNVFVRAGEWNFLLPLAQQCAQVVEEQVGPQHPEMARILHVFGDLSRAALRLNEAADYFRRALAIEERAAEPDRVEIARNLSGLGGTLRDQGHCLEAEPLLKRALAIREAALGTDHPDTAEALSALGCAYWMMGRYPESEGLNQRVLAFYERTGAGEGRAAASAINMLGILRYEQGRYAEALPMFQRALAIIERLDGPDQLSGTPMMNNVAEIHVHQGDYAEAEPLYRRVYAVYERIFGPESARCAFTLSNLSGLHARQGRFAEGEAIARQALEIRRKVMGPEHPEVAVSLCDLAELDNRQGRYDDARQRLQQALAIRERSLGPGHPLVAEALSEEAFSEWKLGNLARAEELGRQALAIRERVFPADSLPVAESLHRLAAVYSEQARYADAEPLYLRALAILEKALGRDHPDTKRLADDLALLRERAGETGDRRTRQASG